MLTLDHNPELFRQTNLHCVYTHCDPLNPAVILWAGTCRLSDVLTPPDAYLSPIWRQEVLPMFNVRLSVVSVHVSDMDAARALMDIVRRHRPSVNLRTPAGGSGVRRRVLCVDTGRIYDNASQAARENGIHQPQMSNHLNGRDAGRVKGKVFRYV